MNLLENLDERSEKKGAGSDPAWLRLLLDSSKRTKLSEIIILHFKSNTLFLIINTWKRFPLPAWRIFYFILEPNGSSRVVWYRSVRENACERERNSRIHQDAVSMTTYTPLDNRLTCGAAGILLCTEIIPLAQVVHSSSSNVFSPTTSGTMTRIGPSESLDRSLHGYKLKGEIWGKPVSWYKRSENNSWCSHATIFPIKFPFLVRLME